MTIRRGYFVWVGGATRRWQPKTKGIKAGDRLFCAKKLDESNKCTKMVEKFGGVNKLLYLYWRKEK